MCAANCVFALCVCSREMLVLEKPAILFETPIFKAGLGERQKSKKALGIKCVHDSNIWWV